MKNLDFFFKKPFVAPNATIYSYLVGKRFIVKPPTSLLEVGCGVGPFCFRYAKAFPETRITAMDVSEQTIGFLENQFGKSHDNLSFVHGDFCQNLPKLGKFDCIYSSDVFEHVAQPKAFVDNFWRHLNPGGQFVLNFPNVETHGVNHFNSFEEVKALFSAFDRVRIWRVKIGRGPYCFYENIRSLYERFFSPESKINRENIYGGPHLGVDSFEKSTCFSFVTKKNKWLLGVVHFISEMLSLVPPKIRIKEIQNGSLRNIPRLGITGNKPFP